MDFHAFGWKITPINSMKTRVITCRSCAITRLKWAISSMTCWRFRDSVARTLATENIDMAALVQRLMHDVRREAGERRVEFIVGALPPCKGDPALLKQVWLNLLLNAVKYSREREVAVIEVGSCDVRDLPNEHGLRRAGRCIARGIAERRAMLGHGARRKNMSCTLCATTVSV
jgi:light-regulated signal transduction histidine kinase (bacteriophytochrome)